MSSTPSPTVTLEGFLQKQCGGLFLKKKQKWAVLRSDGTLSLSRKPELPATSVIFIYEVDDVIYREEDCSIAFASVYNGSIIKAYKFYALESPTFEDWKEALDHIRANPSPEYANGRSNYVRTTVSSFQTDSGNHPRSLLSHEHMAFQRQDARVTITDEELEKQVDPILLIQSSGEEVSMTGYIKKRGGAYGGNTSYKKRFFVLTIFGRVVYFADQKKTQALGQFSLANATIQHLKQQEISVVTPQRVWFLKFDSEASRLAWTEKLEAVTHVTTSVSSPPSSPGKPLVSSPLSSPLASSSSTVSSSQNTTQNLNDSTDQTTPRFRRNMSLLVRQKSNVDGLGFSVLNDKVDKVSENNKNNGGGMSSVSVACVTWNLSESLPKMQQCRFLRQYRKQQIVVVGVQECQSVMYHSFSARQLSPLDIWLAMVKSLMGDPFTLVASRAMGAIHVCVFVREDIIGSISDVNTAFVPCGLGNVMYNKGAVAVSLKCNQTSFGFICAHLAANQERIVERNQDFHRISFQVVDQLGKVACAEKKKSSKIALEENQTQRQAGLFTFLDDATLEDLYTDDDAMPNTSTSPTGRIQAGVEGAGNGSTGTNADSLDTLAREFDRCFFMGDLNYRVDAGKEWVERYLSMAEAMRQNEKRELEIANLQKMAGCLDVTQEHGNGKYRGQEFDAIVDLETEVSEEEEKEVRSSEKKIEKMINLIQVGDYGTDDDDSDEDRPSLSLSVDDNIGPGSSSTLKRSSSSSNLFRTGSSSNLLMTSSIDIMDENSSGVSLDSLRSQKALSSPREATTTTPDELVALQNFQEETKLMTSNSVFSFLLSYDQLSREMGKASVFRGFVEGPIQFKCSYKFDSFTETYDTSRKARSPAWCDRVLYSSPSQVSLDHYRCIHGKFHSDHRAVVAIFTVTL